MNVTSSAAVENLVDIKVHHDGRDLLINLSFKKVDSASFSGTIGVLEHKVMTALCDAMIGVSLREAIEHSVIYAVQKLICDGILARPLGIALPNAMGNEMKLADILVKKMRQQAVDAKLIDESVWNFEDRGLSRQWKEKGSKEKIAVIKGLLDRFLTARGDSLDSILITDIDEYDRINVCLSETIEINKKPKIIMDFESYIRNSTGERLEVFVAEMKDMNRIRRL